jgi:hypothetical protein
VGWVVVAGRTISVRRSVRIEPARDAFRPRGVRTDGEAPPDFRDRDDVALTRRHDWTGGGPSRRRLFQVHHLRGRAEIGLRVGRVINQYKVAKHFTVTITDTQLTFALRTARLTTEPALDGIYVVRTSVPAATLSAADAVRRYESLSGDPQLEGEELQFNARVTGAWPAGAGSPGTATPASRAARTRRTTPCASARRARRPAR